MPTKTSSVAISSNNGRFALKVSAIYLSWRIMLVVVSILGIFFVGARNNDASNPVAQSFKTIWNWGDGGFYHDIAATGYNEPPNSAFGGFPVRTAFFPMYPSLIKVTGEVVFHKDYQWAQLLVSFLAMFGAVIFLALVIRKMIDEKTALITTVIMLLFPFAYFFAAGYSEATFLFFVVGFFYFLLNKQNRYLAALFAAGASATRPAGALLILVLLVEYLKNRPVKFKIVDIFPFVISVCGSVAYMIYLKIHFNNSLIFLEAQKGWRQNIGENFLIPLSHDFIKMFNVTRDLGWPLIVLERILPILVVAAGIYLVYKQKGKYLEIAIYLFASIALPLATGTFGSMTRLVIVIFPLFIVIALILKKRPTILFSYLMISEAMLIMWTIFYNHSIWTG